jgi:hypothetical protein
LLTLVLDWLWGGPTLRAQLFPNSTTWFDNLAVEDAVVQAGGVRTGSMLRLPDNGRTLLDAESG